MYTYPLLQKAYDSTGLEPPRSTAINKPWAHTHTRTQAGFPHFTCLNTQKNQLWEWC